MNHSDTMLGYARADHKKCTSILMGRCRGEQSTNRVDLKERQVDTVLGFLVGKGVGLVAQTAAFVYIYARIPQIAEMTISFHVTV